ncbi:hypothetical protein NDU88_000330 [Pleurodeles waltl]|uniref:Uncharacterized protein n=1 Tax=Pleurodeles waltl TaxID=8319 RepID=A0AAV7UPN7_PLEWA|nr:hypothetical protein NDU88_000330 [Pleurodeles waltl]
MILGPTARNQGGWRGRRKPPRAGVLVRGSALCSQQFTAPAEHRQLRQRAPKLHLPARKNDVQTRRLFSASSKVHQ